MEKGVESEFSIEGVLFPLFSCRDVKQTLSPTKTGLFRRTLSGDLEYLGLEGAQKYASKIYGSDSTLPPFHQNWVGQSVTVSCATTLTESCVVSDQQTITLNREAVDGSVLYNGEVLKKGEGDLQAPHFQVQVDPGETILVSYRPVLKAMMTGFSYKDYEWENRVDWTLSIEEV